MNGRFFARASLALLTTVALDAAAQSDERLVVPLTDPSRPVTLEVGLMFGSITVTANDGNEVVIVTKDVANDDDDDDHDFRFNEPDDDDADEAARREGLRRIPNMSMELNVSERDNAVSVRSGPAPRRMNLEISVPRRTSVRASTMNAGVVTVTGVTGEHELKNMNGDVIATDISGAAVVNTQNGEVRVTFAQVTAGKSMSFSSFNGNVDVAFPANIAAEFRVNSGRGDLLTDFDADFLPQSLAVERGGDVAPDGSRQPRPAPAAGTRGRFPGGYEVQMKREMRAVVGGGGAAIQFRTFNGDVMIRKR